MRFETIKIRNLGTFREAEVDFSRITGQLVAVTGDNGAGKSTLLELLAAGLYRQCPTRGSLGELATARDSMVEVRAVNGRAITARQTVDAISKKGETLILDEAGVPLVESGKVRDADAWVAKHVLSPDVLYASAFSAQASGGFVALKPSERKAVLLRVLQIERLERLAAMARERAAKARTDAEQLRARIADEEARTPDLDLARAELARLEAVADQTAEGAAAARRALETARAAADDVARAAEVRAKRAQLEQRRQRLAREIADDEERIGNNRKLLEREAEIRDAAAQEPVLAAELAAVNAELATVAGEIAKAAAAQEQAARDLKHATERRAKADARAAGARRRLADREVVELAAKLLEPARLALAEIEAERAGAAARLDALHEKLRTMADTRIDALRNALAETLVTVTVEAAHEAASVGLDGDNVLMQAQASGPTDLADAKAAVNAADAKLVVARKQVAQYERDAARAPEMAAAAAELEQAEAEDLAGLEAAMAAKAAATEAEREHAAHIEERDRKRLARERIERDQQTAAALASKLPKLEAATARIEELAKANAGRLADQAEVGKALAELPELGDDAAAVDLAALEQSAEGAEHIERSARDNVGKARAKVEAAEQGAARLERMGSELRELEVLLANWARLAQDLGRDGLQAMEIDAAIPEINAIANDLLHACAGSRFTVTLATQRLDAKGAKQLEGLDVRVLDTEHGRDDLLETFSGGEKVIVAEAVALALTTVACRRAGLERPTLVRDESGAALDPGNGRAYVAMLRRAAKLIGADKVLFVSHTPELQELADARIHVSGGTVEVMA